MIPLLTSGSMSAPPTITTLGQIFSQVDASRVAYDGHTLSTGGVDTLIQAFPTEGLSVTP